MKKSQSILEAFSDSNTHTGKEIYGQPRLWMEVYEKINKQQQDIQHFFEEKGITTSNDVNIILTGAGSSAFIGEIAQYSFRKAGFRNTRAVPTTDLVTHFVDIVDSSSPLLLISFGRSGNSPESKAVIELANRYCEQVSHLIISCNEEGALAKRQGQSHTYTFILPPAAEDQGLAMTGSFSGMALAASVIANIHDVENLRTTVSHIADIGRQILHKYSPLLKDVSMKEFTRIIFLGDGPLLGCARESHLKVQELSDGICLGKFDSFLGFRHGPKAVVTNDALLIYLLSTNEEVLKYQLDLVRQISDQNLGMYSLAIGNCVEAEGYVDSCIKIDKLKHLPEVFLAIPYILVAQIIGFLKSKNLRLNPDNPSQNGAISRVVEGVNLYL